MPACDLPSLLSTSRVVKTETLLAGSEPVPGPDLARVWQGGTVGGGGLSLLSAPEPSEEGALRLMTASLAAAVPMEPHAAFRKFRYPWRMPFLLRGTAGTPPSSFDPCPTPHLVEHVS